jgi:hypothetical protein
MGSAGRVTALGAPNAGQITGIVRAPTCLAARRRRRRNSISEHDDASDERGLRTHDELRRQRRFASYCRGLVGGRGLR